MKIQKPSMTRVDPGALPQAEDTVRAPEDIAERVQAPTSKIATGLNAGAASLRLSTAVRNAQEITLSSDAENALADLLRCAALASDQTFANALAAFPEAAKGAPAAALLSLVELRAEAISTELDDATHFFARVAQLKAQLAG
jgi:hypothetical protein